MVCTFPRFIKRICLTYALYMAQGMSLAMVSHVRMGKQMGMGLVLTWLWAA